MGTGHVVRCLALAEALQDAGHGCTFLCADPPPSLAARLREQGFAVHFITAPAGSAEDAADTAACLRQLDAAALILDGYQFDEGYRAAVRAAGRPVLALDDLADRQALHADLVVNPAPQAVHLPYDRIAPGAVLLLGPAHALLRREIRAARAWRTHEGNDGRNSGGSARLLLTFGGSDPLGLTVPTLERLAVLLPPDVCLVVVVGGSNPAVGVAEAAGRRLGPRVELHIDSARMGALMAEAGLAVSAAGGTTAELAALAVPSLLVTVAANQNAAAAECAALGWARVVDGRQPDAPQRIAEAAAELWRSPAERAAMAARAAGLVDGEGAVRVAHALLQRTGLA